MTRAADIADSILRQVLVIIGFLCAVRAVMLIAGLKLFDFPIIDDIVLLIWNLLLAIFTRIRDATAFSFGT